MALDTFEAEIDGYRDEAKTLIKRRDREVAGVQANPNLTDAGKREEIANLDSYYKPAAKALRAKEDAAIVSKETELKRRIESRAGVSSTDIIAFRDAQDRADRLESSSEAQRMLERALRQQDTSLAHAIFRRSIDEGWRDVLETFVAAHPDLKDVVRDLNTITAFKANTMPRTMAYAIFS